MGEASPFPVSALGAPAQFTPDASDLVVYVLNVGDGDSIVIQFPEDDDERAYAVVDCYRGEKTEALLEALGATGLRFVCATHPHYDHIAGLRRIIRNFDTEEFWDSGFRYTSSTYNGIITEVLDRGVQFMRPTSGFETWVHGARITVLSPSIALRNRYDTYGIDPNNASIVLRIEYPYLSPEQGFPQRGATGDDDDNSARSIILGGDAQTDAWSQVLSEFPHLDPDSANWSRLIGARTGREPLLCDVMKVSHHGSKHGVSLELVERFGDSGSAVSRGPRYLVFSSAHQAGSSHGFPHRVTQEILREVRQPLARSGAAHRPDEDHELGIHYTAQELDPGGSSAGSVAAVFKDDGSVPRLYRFGDAVDDDVPLALSRLVQAVPARP